MTCVAHKELWQLTTNNTNSPHPIWWTFLPLAEPLRLQQTQRVLPRSRCLLCDGGSVGWIWEHCRVELMLRQPPLLLLMLMLPYLCFLFWRVSFNLLSQTKTFLLLLLLLYFLNFCNIFLSFLFFSFGFVFLAMNEKFLFLFSLSSTTLLIFAVERSEFSQSAHLHRARVTH